MSKKIAALVLATVVTLGAALTAGAAGSIVGVVPENLTVESTDESLGVDYEVVMTSPDTSQHSDETLAEIIDTTNDSILNDSDETPTVKDVAQALEESGYTAKSSKKTATTSGDLYNLVSPFYDVVKQDSDGNYISGSDSNTYTLTFTLESLVGCSTEDVSLMVVDPVTGEYYFVPFDELDSESGTATVTLTFSDYVCVAVVEGVDLVVTDTRHDHDDYGHKNTETFIKERQEKLAKDKENGNGDGMTDPLPDILGTLADIDFSSKEDLHEGDIWHIEEKDEAAAPEGTEDNGTASLENTGTTKTTSSAEAETEVSTEAETETEVETEYVLNEEIEVADGVTIKIADYSSCMAFADLAIKLDEEEYNYDMSGTVYAEAYRDLEKVDWKRIVLYMDPDYDVEAAEEDYTLLTEIEPFVLEDCFVMQINSETGEISYIWEPEIYFLILDVEESEEETETETEEVTEAATEAESELETEEQAHWSVEDESKESENHVPVVVIKGEYQALGPFALFMPVDSELTTD
ncbi:MAG: hypothetical protein LUG99_18210 [Lachnospiraceae bacterium]|nr:hypothetical protein [Lachnospiraceae bacterium]